jgi:hypothetical protein
MDFDVTREQWIERFAMHLSRREAGALPDEFLEIAARRYETRGQIPPEAAADEESARPPPAGAEVASALDGQERFERTERIPVERIESADDYVRDTAEWIARCVARVLALDPIIRAEEAQRSVSELAGLERWRLMKPEAAAEQLYTPIRPR